MDRVEKQRDIVGAAGQVGMILTTMGIRKLKGKRSTKLSLKVRSLPCPLESDVSLAPSAPRKMLVLLSLSFNGLIV